MLKFIANKKPKIDGAFIKELYKLVLGREAENAEVVNSKLVYKDRFTLVKHFLESDEFQQIVSTKNYSFLHQAEGVLTQKNGFSFVFPSNDTCQLQEIISHGSYQHQELKTAFAYLREKNFLDGNILFDIGANVGTHSIYALNEPEINHVIAVEPSKRNVEFLKMNLLLNQVADKVDIVISAVGDKNSCATLIKSPNNCGDYRLSSTVTSGNLQNEETFETETVSVVTLDNLLDKYDCKKIALFWIDTQGSEGLILGDSKKISETKSPLYIEFWPYGMNKLQSYSRLKDFILREVKSIVRFKEGQPVHYTPEQIDIIYNEFNQTVNFCDLLLIR